MKPKFRKGANGALMDLYENQINDLQDFLKSIPRKSYLKKISNDKYLGSIKSIISHVLNSGYVYANYYRNRLNKKIKVTKIKCSNPLHAVESLNQMFRYTLKSLKGKWEMNDDEMMKILIKTRWTVYDLESLWEHAIVHIMRHKRQIQKSVFNVQ